MSGATSGLGQRKIFDPAVAKEIWLCVRMYFKICNKFFIHYFQPKLLDLFTITNITRDIFLARHFLTYMNHITYIQSVLCSVLSVIYNSFKIFENTRNMLFLLIIASLRSVARVKLLSASCY